MALLRKILLDITIILFLFTTTCVKAQKPFARHLDMAAINCLDVNLPITFSLINYDYPPNEIPAKVEEKIREVIVDFYLESNGGDSSEISKAKDYYFNTLRTRLSKYQLFIVILKTPLFYSHCKLFLYDSVNNAVAKTTIDYNTWAMYSIDDNSLVRSNLFKALNLSNDDMLLVQKKQPSLLLKRIKHIGTHNELEEITYYANGLSLDTVSFKSRILQAN